MHLLLIVLALIWLVPTVGLGVTSFRSRGDIAQSGWWTTVVGNRSTIATPLELAVVAESDADGADAVEAGTTLTVAAADSSLLDDTTPGFPTPTVGDFRVLEVSSQLAIEAPDQPVEIAGIGTITVGEDGAIDFIPAAGFDGFFIAEVDVGQRPIVVDYRLTGRESLQGQIEVEEIGDGVRIPRTGTLTVLADGNYTFEPRSSFVGTFEASLEPNALEQRPITVNYRIERAAGILLSASADNPLEVPLAGTLLVNRDGSYQFAASADFAGTVAVDVAANNPSLTLQNYSGVLQREDLPPPGFVDNLRNSFIITIPSTILPILIASLAAYAFAWMRFPFRDLLYLMMIALLVVPLQTTWVPVLKILNGISLNGTFPGIWITHSAYGIPFAIFLLYNFFRDLPGALFESARIDGANEITIFSRIVLPLSLPAIASLAIFQFVWVWNDLMNALIFLDRDKAPLTIGIRNLLGQYGNEWHLLAAGAFVTMIVPLVVFFAFQRYFVRGVTAGAVKG